MASVYPTAREYADRTTFQFPYDPEMVEAFKAIPLAFRSYDPATRIWTVRTPYEDRALDRFLRRFPGADVIDRQEGGAIAPPLTHRRPRLRARTPRCMWCRRRRAR